MASATPDGRLLTDLAEKIAAASALIAIAESLIEGGRPVDFSVLEEAIVELAVAVSEGETVDEEFAHNGVSALERGLASLADLQTARCQAFARYRQEVLERSPFRNPPRRLAATERVSGPGPESRTR